MRGVFADVPEQITAVLQLQIGLKNGEMKPVCKLHHDLLVLKGKLKLWLCLKALTAEWKANTKLPYVHGVSMTWSKQCVKWWAKPLFHVLY